RPIRDVPPFPNDKLSRIRRVRVRDGDLACVNAIDLRECGPELMGGGGWDGDVRLSLHVLWGLDDVLSVRITERSGSPRESNTLDADPGGDRVHQRATVDVAERRVSRCDELRGLPGALRPTDFHV